ncbi:MAG TPA: non-homologous end-joining DNA ligase [Mycobacteriales bacterium]|nr:non-homologous end-joining DNA ligase [Mycobacteriales bacterium]
MASPFVEVPVGDRVVKVTNPDRVYFPARGETKLDLVNYYLSVGEGIVRALYERPCMLHRYPEGVGASEKIYQKRIPKGAPDWVQTAEVSFPSGRTADELCVTELASVIWAVQMSTVEFHPWHTRRDAVEQPDELRIDLDPQPGTDFADAKQVAELVREVLADVGWIGWPKTSGNRGIHIYVRIEPTYGFRQVRRAALAFAREVERRAPEAVTTAWWKEERGARVFVDFNQNAKDRTIAAAYSVRGFAHAPVSAPLTWEELPDVDTEDFTIATMPDRFARLGDVHASIDDVSVGIEPLLEWAERDETDHGLGDAPYPPNYPKIPGEPPRVAPSKINPANWPAEPE